MAIAASISSTELTAQVTNRFSTKTFEAVLINAPSTTYQPGVTNDATFLSNEVAYLTGGYQRQVFTYLAGDVSAYTDGGVALGTKVAIFSHDNSATPMAFSHVALLWGLGNATALGSNTVKPASGVNGTYTNLPTVSSGSGKGLTVNLTVTGAGGTLANWALTIAKPGYGYAAAESVQILNGTLLSAGAIASGITGSLTFPVSTVTTGGGQILCVAKTSTTVSLNGGNQAAFNFNLKHYGFN
jgi:hypothetical protein